MGHLLRVFIAIEINHQIRKALTDAQVFLKQTEAHVSWVRPENIHLTLKFLGEIKPKKVKTVLEIFPSLAHSIKPFEMNLRNLGVFPNLQHPKIVWAGISPGEELRKLIEQIEIEMAKCGFRKEIRDFTGHLTIGRTKSEKNIAELTKAIADYKFSDSPIQYVEHITLFQSTLTSSGPIYESISSAPLKH